MTQIELAQYLELNEHRHQTAVADMVDDMEFMNHLKNIVILGGARDYVDDNPELAADLLRQFAVVVLCDCGMFAARRQLADGHCDL